MRELGLGEPSDSAIAADRQIRMLRTAMGPAIAAALEDPQVVEVMVNPNGALWLDRLRSGREPTGVGMGGLSCGSETTRHHRGNPRAMAGALTSAQSG